MIAGWIMWLLTKAGVRSPLWQGGIISGVAVLAIGGAVLGVIHWDNKRLQERYDAGYRAAVAECKTAQLETTIANLTRDLAAARKKAAEETARNEQLSARLAEVEQENFIYAEERAKLGASRCPADDPAVIHDRRLRRRGQTPAG